MKAMILSRSNQAADRNIDSRFVQMIRSLKRGGIDATHYRVIDSEDLILCLREEQPQIVFSAADHTDDGRNIHEILEDLNQPYIGSSPETIELALSKSALKDHWQHHGILTPGYHVVKKTSDGKVLGLKDLGAIQNYPYIVKPSKEGNSRGLEEDSVVFNRAELDRLIARLLKKYDELLVEEYLGCYPGMREFTAAMIGNGENALVMPVEIILNTPRRWRIVTTGDKDGHHTSAIPLADEKLALQVETAARRALLSAGVRDYARCDLIMAGGKIYAIEINGQPMVPDRWFAACARTKNLDDDQYLNAIFWAGLVRTAGQDHGGVGVLAEMPDFLPELL